MARTATEKRQPKPLTYQGATTCDFVLDWRDTNSELLALLRSCHEADPDDQAPRLVLADWLEEHGDQRHVWVRVACDLWASCQTITPAGDPWDYQQVKAALTPVCESVAGWRLSCLWGCLVAWHCPSGDGQPMGRTWVDARVGATWRGVWWWSLGFAATKPVDAAAGSQAYAAGSQAYAAGSQAYAAGSQAYAAGSQADAAGRQADAAGSQADAAGRQVWQFARQAWELCAAKLPLLEPSVR